MLLNYSGFSLKLFLTYNLSVKGVTSSENQRNICESLLISHFIIAQYREGTEQQIVYR